MYEIVVRGPRGAKWWAASNARTEDEQEACRWVAELSARYPQLEFDVFPATVLRKLAPSRYRPWDYENECRTMVSLLTF